MAKQDKNPATPPVENTNPETLADQPGEIVEQPAELAARVEALEAELETLLEENDTLRAKVAELSAMPAAAPRTSAKVLPLDNDPFAAFAEAAKPFFEYAGVNYRFRVAAFWLGGIKRRAVDVAQDENVLAEIVEKYPGLIETV